MQVDVAGSVSTSSAFDVVVVGAGPAGIAAAATAAEHGQRVAQIDDNFHAGGQIWRPEQLRSPRSARGSAGSREASESAAWMQRLNRASLTRWQGWRVVDSPAPGALRIERMAASSAGGQPFFRDVHYRNLILATGARERFLPFPGWTLPHVLGAGALQALVKSGLPILGQRVAVAGSGPLLLAVAAFLQARGAHVLCIAEQAAWSSLASFAAGLATHPRKLAQAAHYGWGARNVPFHAGCLPVSTTVEQGQPSVLLSNGSRQWKLACDYLACGFHLVPNTELAAMLGCRIHDRSVAVDDLQRTSIAGVYCAGEPTGIGGLELALVEGEIAGMAAAGATRHVSRLLARRHSLRRFARKLERTFRLRDAIRGLPGESTIVCRCEDVRFAELRPHSGWRSAKLHTRCGMGACQGRVCGPATQVLFGWNPESPRPPLFPTEISSLMSLAPPAAKSPQPEKEMA